MTALASAGALLEAVGRRARRRARAGLLWASEHRELALTGAGVVLLAIALGWFVVWAGGAGGGG